MSDDFELWAPEIEGEHHYFATTPLAYATAETREEAIEKAVRHSDTLKGLKAWILNHHKKGDPGIYVWSAKVAGKEKNYKIEWYAPVGVDWEDSKEHFVTYLTAKEIAYHEKEAA